MNEALFSIGAFDKAASAQGDVVNALMIYHSLKGNRGASVIEGPFFDLSRWQYEDMETSAPVIEAELKRHCYEYLKIQVQRIMVIPRDNKTLIISIQLQSLGKESNSPINFLVKKNGTGVLVDYIEK